MPGFQVTKEQRAELVFECAGGIRYLKPQMPKLAFCSAWRNVDPRNGRAASVWLSDTAEQVNLLVVGGRENAALSC